MSVWLDWEQLKGLIEKKKVVFFGAGVELVEKTIQKINRSPLCILDNSQNMQNTKLFDQINITAPKEIHNEKSDFIILITTTAINSVASQLTEMGFQPGIDYFCSPILFNQKVEQDIKNIDQTLIFTCSDGEDIDSFKRGGGLYTFNIKTGDLTKHFSGRLRQITESKKYYYIADAMQGILVFDKKLNHISTITTLPGSITHGIAYNADKDILYVANTGRDSISVICAKSGVHLDEINISQFSIDGQTDCHHINDLYYYEGNLFISMFSFSGLWRQGCYDGGVAIMNIEMKETVSYPIKDLWMPHSICFIKGDIVILDSMRGDVYKTSNKKLVNVNGFARGINFDGNYYYIGQSEQRHFDRLKDSEQGMIHLNCGIHVYDEVTNIGRFYSFESLSNIHSIVVME
ncbi:DUF4915 domain-containing protein [Virgibacillus sp. L01]|uniref:DUF4915 domain-containing protein n=1 Tax=Virgibacillus sp. L01 TaxID=3457429 RepID=UPI003FD4598E